MSTTTDMPPLSTFDCELMGGGLTLRFTDMSDQEGRGVRLDIIAPHGQSSVLHVLENGSFDICSAPRLRPEDDEMNSRPPKHAGRDQKGSTHPAAAGDTSAEKATGSVIQLFGPRKRPSTA